MKVSLDWLNQYLDRPAPGDDVERMMMDQGMPIETRSPIASDDEMLDVEVTSNRSDCLCHLGVAREVAAGSGKLLKPPADTLPTGSGPEVGALTSVANERTDLCPTYTVRVITGVKVGASPKWLIKRLEAVGLRSVNNVVDVTNFVMLELGQPLHAFDMARLAGRRIVVRAARPSEPFVAIDGTKHTLATAACPEMLVIADAERPVAVAGVMGGKESEVTALTRDVLLESAVFTPLSIRRTSRALKLASDSSYRYERGVPRAGVEAASRRAAALILELAGGTLAPGVIRTGSPEVAAKTVKLRLERVGQVLGFPLPDGEILRILSALGFSPTLDAATRVVECTVPGHRLDVYREIDLVEEIARLHGVDKVPVKEKILIQARAVQPDIAARRKLRQTLVAAGYLETVTFSFVNPKQSDIFVPPGEQAVVIDDERRKSEPMLRPSVLPSLMVCRKANQDVGNHDVQLFETASTWTRVAGEIVERTRLGLLADAQDPGLALRGLRGTAEELIRTLAGDRKITLGVLPPGGSAIFSSGATVAIDGEAAGVIGVVSAAVAKLFDLQTPVVAGELDLHTLIKSYPPVRLVRQLARFPGIERDLSVVVDETVAWGLIEAAVQATAPPLLERIDFLVTYRGKPVAAGKKSVSFRMLFRDPAATLRHEQVDPQVASVIDRLKSAVGAELRV